MPAESTVYSNAAKQSDRPRDPVTAYTIAHTSKLTQLQEELQDATYNNAPMGRMHGMPEVLTFGQHFIRSFGGKRVLDIGTFTGASALAWALAVPDDGEVLTFDIDHTNYRTFGVPILEKCQKTFAKIRAVEGPAVESLDKLIADGHAGSFDFAFIDADKTSYCAYYERAVTLLRKGGVIFVDNSLLGGSVADPSTRVGEGSWSGAVHEMNERIYRDERTYSALLTLGDGTHIVFKK